MRHLPFLSRRRDEQACAWVVKLDRGLAASEKDEFADWMRSPANRDALAQYGTFWGSLDLLSEHFPRNAKPKVDEQPIRSRGLRTAVVAAAGFACISVIAWFMVSGTNQLQFGKHSVVVTPTAVRVFATAVGGMRTIDLEDGTTVVLNTDTLLQVEYSPTVRQIRLQRGEAHFDVAPDTSRSFRVRAGSHDLTAVGTVFNVEERPGDIVELIVTEGEVRVVAGGDTGVPASPDALGDRAPGSRLPVQASVFAGEVALITPGRPTVTAIGVEDVGARLAWRRGMLMFQGETLEDVLSEFARYSPIPLEMADATLRSTPVVGYFEVGDLDALFQLLSENFEIDAERHDGRITLRAR